jgi:hypothetical protein
MVLDPAPVPASHIKSVGNLYQFVFERVFGFLTVKAVDKAFADAEDWNNCSHECKPRTPMTKAVAAGRILEEDKERAAKLQAALIEKGGGSVDPFAPELQASSNPRFELVPAIPGMEGSEHRRDMLRFLSTACEVAGFLRRQEHPCTFGCHSHSRR